MFKINPTAKLIFAMIFCLLLAIAAAAQDPSDDDDPPTRSITSKDFKAKRAKSSGRSRPRRNRVTTSSRRRYNHTNRRRRKRPAPKVTVKPKLVEEQLGVTLWRLRPLTLEERTDEFVSVLSVLVDRATGRRENWTAERVNSTTEFRPGDRVRLTVESSRTGYLYIVNREFYTDGTSGQPSLIFPTLRTRGGDNRVRAGSLIEIPSSDDRTPYFTITPRREDYAGEELAVIITKEPLPGIEIERDAQRITPEKIEKWLEEWGATVDIYDAEDGVGVAYSTEEAAAANSATRELTQEEPLPQTIYRVKVREDLPFIIPIQMQAVVQ